VVAGNTKSEIATRLALSPHTIDGHVRNTYTKLYVNKRSGAVAKAINDRIL
jgi:DNA-binding CsgD family transcriptional regulator